MKKLWLIILLLVLSYAKLADASVTRDEMEMILKHPSELNNNHADTDLTNFSLLLRTVKNPEIIEEAIAKGANPNVKDKIGNTPLHILSFYNLNAVDVLDVLTKNMKDLNAKGSEGKTALMMAIEQGQGKEFISHLIDAGADVNLVSNNNSAISLAAEYRGTDIISLLLEKGAVPGPKAMQILECVDRLDTNVEHANFYRLSHQQKHKYFAETEKIRNIYLPNVTYTKDTNEGQILEIHGIDAEEYLKKEPGDLLDPTGFNYTTSSDVIKDFSVYFISGIVLNLLNKDFPELTATYLGEVTEKEGYREVYDQECQDALAYSDEIHRNSTISNCFKNARSTVPISEYGRLTEICANIEREEYFSYPERRRRILNNCKTVKEKIRYNEFGAGGIKYSYKDNFVAFLETKQGKISPDLTEIPYSKLLEEIQKKYGYPTSTSRIGSKDYILFEKSGRRLDRVVIVSFNEGEIIKPESNPKQMVSIVIDSQNLLNAIQEVIDDNGELEFESDRQKELDTWERLKADYDDKLNSFEL